MSVRLIVEVFFTAEDFEKVEVIHAGCVEIRAYAVLNIVRHMLGIDAVLVGRDRESKLLALTFDIFLHQRQIICQIPQLSIAHPLPHVVRERIREIEPAVTA